MAATVPMEHSALLYVFIRPGITGLKTMWFTISPVGMVEIPAEWTVTAARAAQALRYI